MKAFIRFFAQISFWLVSIGLMIYATSRSLNFIQSTLSGQDQILGIFALLATSGGMVAWLLVFLHKSEGIVQRGVALLMVVVDFLGEAALFTFDTLQQAGMNGVTTELAAEEVRTVLIGMSALIALNILATIVFHLGDMEVIRQIVAGAQMDILFLKSMAEIEKQSDEYARSMAPGIAQEWKTDFNEAYGSAAKLGLTRPGAPASAPSSPAPQALAFFPMEARLAGVHMSGLGCETYPGMKLEAAKNERGFYIVRFPGQPDPYSEISEYDLLRLVTGNEALPFAAAGNGNGAHP